MSEPWPVGEWRSDGPNRDRFCRCPCSTCVEAAGYDPGVPCPDCPVHGRMTIAEMRQDWLSRTKGAARPVRVRWVNTGWLFHRGWWKVQCREGLSRWFATHAEAVAYADAHARQHHSGWHLWDS